MAPKKRTTRSIPATTTTTLPVTNAQLKALIDQGVADALAARDADRSMNGNDSHNSGTGVRRNERVVREYTYPDFMKCQPLNFKGMEGVVKLTQWFEKMETVFSIRTYSVENKIKPKKKMTEKYCPMGKIKKLEVKLWNLKTRPKGSKDDNNNEAQQQPPKKQGVAIAYTVGPGERKEYAGTLPLCNKCKFHHNGQCTVKSDCPKLKNQNHRNQAGGTRARGMVHALGGGEINQDLNNMEGDIIA
ncbi:hypothetical protein Tco_0760902 [Tanacetum coccineum]